MAEAALEILTTLDRHLGAPAEIRLLGGAAVILGYGFDRATEDADLLQDERELEILVEQADFGSALEATPASSRPRASTSRTSGGRSSRSSPPNGARRVGRFPNTPGFSGSASPHWVP